jgi:ATP-dependent Clp protease ATP-binding subunit ClpA
VDHAVFAGSLRVNLSTNGTSRQLGIDFEVHKGNEDAWQLAENLRTSINTSENIWKRYADYKDNTRDLEHCLTIYENFITAQEDSQELRDRLSKLDLSLTADFANYSSELVIVKENISSSIKKIAANEGIQQESVLSPMKDLLEFIERFQQSIKQSITIPLDTLSKDIKHELTTYYLHAINESVCFVEFFPDQNENITEVIRSFRLWSKPKPELWNSYPINEKQNPTAGRDAIPSSLSAFYNTRAADTIREILDRFTQELTDQVKEALDPVWGIEDVFKDDMETLDKLIKKTWSTTLDPTEDFVR